MTTRGSDIVSVIRRQIEEFQGELRMVDVGTVVEAGDGIARIQGLQGAQYSELLEFPEGVLGLALNLEEDTVGAAIMGDANAVKDRGTRSVPRGASLRCRWGTNSWAGWWTRWDARWTGKDPSERRRSGPSSVLRPTWSSGSR